ncbi:50S ribosomal protein L18 [Synechococcus sp. KORDI-52]|uniref:50S ribosomal protein L18 n=1 Tax=Synechococcus sp. KORDI-52 TaxID=585425 RepID=UPI0004E0359C|nr:50S ribosomal protein L18 [Synechococcus sp. KORDI-52]AII47518.1 50S ribosomal protein L18 [Synechococcus sp. KORDI-52]
MSKLSRKQQTQKRHRRLRRHISGTSDRPRLAVFRSNNHIYAQVIDDADQSTLCSASTVDKELRTSLKTTGGSCDASVAVGELVAKRAIAKGIQQVVFDRGGNLYHGRVKALADAAREAGLQF